MCRAWWEQSCAGGMVQRAGGKEGDMSVCMCVHPCVHLLSSALYKGEWIHRAAWQEAPHCTDGETEAWLALKHAESGQNQAPQSHGARRRQMHRVS